MTPSVNEIFARLQKMCWTCNYSQHCRSNAPSQNPVQWVTDSTKRFPHSHPFFGIIELFRMLDWAQVLSLQWLRNGGWGWGDIFERWVGIRGEVEWSGWYKDAFLWHLWTGQHFVLFLMVQPIYYCAVRRPSILQGSSKVHLLSAPVSSITGSWHGVCTWCFQPKCHSADSLAL